MNLKFPSGTVTFLFTDIEGSTKLAHQHRDKWESLRSRHDTILRSSIESHKGYVFQIIGDAFCAAFHTVEDALEASINAQLKLHEEKWGETPFKVRMGIHTGKAEIQQVGDYHGYAAMSRVQRLMSAGHGGQILLSLASQELVRDELPLDITLRDMGFHRLKDLIHPEHIFQVVIPSLQSDFPALRTLNLQLNNLPCQMTPLVGREREISALLGLLRNTNVRIVTLSGTGGTGKTRLSLQVAAELVDEYTDGVWFVSLAAITDPELVLPAIASTFKLKEPTGTPVEQILLEYLHNRHLLLVLDNFEQVVSAAPLISRLLEDALKVKVMVTSREVLRLHAEHVFPVPPLGLPDSTCDKTAEVLSQYESISLFIQHANASQPSFFLNQENAPIVAQICWKLDGLPLAIELAAARTRMLAPSVMLEKLNDRQDLLISGARDLPDRHQTMRAAIDWSYALLAEDERQLFCRLCVFSGGWTINSAESICSGKGIEPGQILNLLASLLDKSLITIDLEGKRYSMLETIKQFAAGKLLESGKYDWCMQRHLDFFLEMAEIIDEKIRGPEQFLWYEKTKPEHDNLKSALTWAFNSQSQIEKGLLLVYALNWYWGMVGEILTVRYWLANAYSKKELLGNVPAMAKILFALASTSDWGMNLFDPAETLTMLEKSLEIWNGLGPDFIVEKGKTILALGVHLKVNCGDQNGLEMVHESIDIFKATKQTWWHAWALNLIVLILEQDNSNPHEIRKLIEEETTLWKKTGDKSMIGNVLADLGELDLRDGEFAEAEKKLQNSLAIFKDFGSTGGWIFQVLFHLGQANRGLNKYEQAEKCYSESIICGQDMVGWEGFYAALYYGLGFVCLHKGELVQAQNYFCQSLQIAQEHNFKSWLVHLMAGFAAHAQVSNKPLIAGRLFGAFFAQIEGLYAKYGRDQMIIHPVDQKEIDHYFSSCRVQLPEVIFNQAWEAGSKLTLDEVLQEILPERYQIKQVT